MALLEVSHLKKYFQVSSGILHAVDDVSFTLEQGKTLGVVGESGCGKSTLGKAIIRLTHPTAGKVVFDGTDVAAYSAKEFKKVRPNMQMIFQDPFASLDPRRTVTELIAEPMKIYKTGSRDEIYKRVKKLMDTVGLAERFQNSYPPRAGRRPPPAYRHRPGSGPEPQVHRLRRAGVRPGRVHPGPGAQSAAGPAAGSGADLYVHHPRYVRGQTHLRRYYCHVPGTDRGEKPAKELFVKQYHPYTRALLSAIPVPSPAQPPGEDHHSG